MLQFALKYWKNSKRYLNWSNKTWGIHEAFWRWLSKVLSPPSTLCYNSSTSSIIVHFPSLWCRRILRADEQNQVNLLKHILQTQKSLTRHSENVTALLEGLILLTLNLYRRWKINSQILLFYISNER